MRQPLAADVVRGGRRAARRVRPALHDGGRRHRDRRTALRPGAVRVDRGIGVRAVCAQGSGAADDAVPGGLAPDRRTRLRARTSPPTTTRRSWPTGPTWSSSTGTSVEAGELDHAEELREAIHEADAELRQLGVRGSLPSPDAPGRRPVTRSTKRRQDAPNLPRRAVAKTTVGREYAGRFRPSMFVTLTCDSYGPVRDDGTPVDPDRYDYRRAARDAVHFSSLVDRWWQNLRRVVGWDAQYFATVEPQRRAAPHLHAAIRGQHPARGHPAGHGGHLSPGLVAGA